jgi:hypothetical protein
MVETLARRTVLLIQARKQIQQLQDELARKDHYLNALLDANLTLAKKNQKLQYALDCVCECSLRGAN